MDSPGRPGGQPLLRPEPREVCRDTGPIAAVVVDCTTPRTLARFWGEAMGWTTHEATADFARLRSPGNTGPYLEFLRIPDPTSDQHRLHLDLVPTPGTDQATEVTRLRHLGATPADVGQGVTPWTVLADPEGNEFCVLAPP